MGYNSSRHVKSYDRLQVPDNPERRRANLSPDYEDTVRRIESGRKQRSQTLQYKFDFSRPAGKEAGGRKRLSAAPNIVEPAVPRAGTASSNGLRHAEPRPRVPKEPPRKPHPAPGAHHKQGETPVRSGQKSVGRPASSFVTDFQTVGPKVQQPREGSIRAPRLSETGTPRGTQSGNLHSANRASHDTDELRRQMPLTAPAAKKHASPKSPDVTGSAKYKPAPKPPGLPGKPGKRTLNPARGGSDQSASTVVGFDISRSVFEKSPVSRSAAPEPSASQEQSVAARTEWSVPRFKNTLFTIVMIAAIFVLLAVSLMLSARVSDVTRKNAQMQKDNDRIEAAISKVEMQIALEEDLSNVKERASGLGLALPEESQIQYVELEDEPPGAGTEQHEAAEVHE